MTRRSSVNGFVVFPTKDLENEWSKRIPASTINRNELAAQFEHLLNNAQSEAEVHSFFEDYPQLLPEVGFYHHGPRGDLVVTKLPLGEDFICDFAFVSENSQMVQFTCVEIESPSKKLFNSGAKFSREYLDDKQQITDWNCWAQQNIKKMTRLFDRLGEWLPAEYYAISLRCILVMGRRSEINTTKRKQRWAAENALRQASMEIMTYDRLLERISMPYHGWSERMLVCNYRDRALHAKSISR